MSSLLLAQKRVYLYLQEFLILFLYLLGLRIYSLSFKGVK
jgi:hypothetical protein